MDRHIDIGGHPTRLIERGTGSETVLLLHGGLDSADGLMRAIGEHLAQQRRVVAFDRRGHGRTADTDDAFHYDTMTDETIAVIEQIGGPVHLVGWSDGGIVGLLLARRRPDLLTSMVVIGTNFHYDAMLTSGVEAASPAYDEMLAEYAERSPDGADHFPVVFEKSMTLWATEPTMTIDDLREITVPTLVLAGDDEMIALHHTCDLYEALPNGQLAIVPGTSHALPFERPAETAQLVEEFIVLSPIRTFIPVRRAPRVSD